MDYHPLEKIGLTKSEVLVYTGLLKIGVSTAGKIVKEAKISSGKIYEVLDKLLEKGLISFSLINNVKHFEATDPDKIEDYLNRKKQDLEETEKEIKNLIPSLKDIKVTTENEYATSVYQGYEGLKTVLFNTLKDLKKGEWLGMGVTTAKRSERIDNMWHKWYKMRNEKNIDVKLILSDKETASFFKKRKVQLKLLEGLTPSPIAIVGNRVMIYDWEKLSVVLIDNERIATSFRTFFYSLWKTAKALT